MMNKSRSGYKRVKWLFGKEIEIPDEWNMLKLIELSDDKPQYGSGNPALQYTSKLPRYIRITDIDDDGNLKNNAVSVNLTNNEKNLLEEDDFLFARTGSVGRTFLFSSKFGRCVYAGYLIRFRLNKEKFLPKFLHYYTHSRRYWVWVTSELTHGVQPNLNAQQYSKLTILVPLLLEQTKIASILSGVDALIESTQKTIEKTEKLKKGLMQNLLTRGIDHAKFKKVKWIFGKEIEIPEEWKIKKIKDVTKISVGLVINPSSYFDDNGIIPMITGKNVTEKGIVLDNVDFISEKNNKLLEKTRIWSGDLVTMRVGYPGRTSLVKNENNGINCASLIITRKNKKYISQFLCYLTNSKLFSKQIIMYQAGSAQEVVNVGSWEKFLVTLPPLFEQTKIASILLRVDAYIQKNQEYKKKMELLKKGLIQKLLTGQIRVKVDH